MRPRGEIRAALLQAACTLHAQRMHAPVLTAAGGMAAGATYIELIRATGAPIGVGVGRQTVKDMRRYGDLRVVGTVRQPGISRELALYAPADPDAWAGPGPDATAIQEVMHAWLS